MSADSDRPCVGNVGVAWDIAEAALSGALPRRWAHSQGVWRQAGMVSVALDDEDAALLAQAAILHDVGYAPELVSTGFHPLDGARHLRSIGLADELISLVAHHSGARTEAEHRGLHTYLDEFDPGPPELSDCLTFCDLTTSPDGSPVTVDERLAEIRQRHGPDSLKGQFLGSAEPELRAAAARIAARVAPQTGPEAVGS